MSAAIGKGQSRGRAQAASPPVRFTPLPVTLGFPEHVPCEDQGGKHLPQPLYISPRDPAWEAHGIANGGSVRLGRLPRVTWMRGVQDPGPGLPHCEADGMLPELVEILVSQGPGP